MRFAMYNGETIMATYGLKIFDENGRAILDSNDYVARLRWTQTVSAGSSGTTTVSGITGRKPFGCGMALGDGLAHGVFISGDTVTYDPRSWAGEPSVDTLIYLFLLN